MKLLIEQENVQKLLNYLLTRPYGEVYELIPLVINLPVVNLTDSPPQELPPLQEPEAAPPVETSVEAQT